MLVLAKIGKLALFVTVTLLAQLSVAVGAVKLVTEHCAVIAGRVATSGVGAILSFTTTLCDCVDVFPFPSS